MTGASCFLHHQSSSDYVGDFTWRSHLNLLRNKQPYLFDFTGSKKRKEKHICRVIVSENDSGGIWLELNMVKNPGISRTQCGTDQRTRFSTWTLNLIWRPPSPPRLKNGSGQRFFWLLVQCTMIYCMAKTCFLHFKTGMQDSSFKS